LGEEKQAKDSGLDDQETQHEEVGQQRWDQGDVQDSFEERPGEPTEPYDEDENQNRYCVFARHAKDRAKNEEGVERGEGVEHGDTEESHGEIATTNESHQGHQPWVIAVGPAGHNESGTEADDGNHNKLKHGRHDIGGPL